MGFDLFLDSCKTFYDLFLREDILRNIILNKNCLNGIVLYTPLKKTKGENEDHLKVVFCKGTDHLKVA
jgi:hypothetical protein